MHNFCVVLPKFYTILNAAVVLQYANGKAANVLLGVLGMVVEDIGKLLGELASTTAKKAGEQANLAKLALERTVIDNQLEDVYISIGKKCVALNKAGGSVPEEVLSRCKDVEQLTGQLLEINEQMELHRRARDEAKYRFTPAGEDEEDDVLFYHSSPEEKETDEAEKTTGEKQEY